MKRYRYPALALLLLAAGCGTRPSQNAADNADPSATTFEASPNRRPAPALRLADSGENATGSGENAAEAFRIDSVVTLRGQVVVAHEVRAFIPEGRQTEYWLVDPSGELERRYDRVSGGATDGMPLRAELELRYKGPSDEGFAAEYAGVFEVVRIRSMEREPESKR